jgi:MIP family channel proteins
MVKRSRYIAEFTGTLTMVFAGCSAIIVNDQFGGVLGHLGISTVFGLVVMAVIYSIGNISGAHINPAVTIGFWAVGKMKMSETFLYVIVQVAGAIVAALILRFMFPGHETLGSTLPAVSPIRAVIFEALISFILMFVILNISTGNKEKGIMAGVAVGGTVALLALLGGPVTGASLNPARSIGPMLVSGYYQHTWVYIVGPVIGMLLAIPVYLAIQENGDKNET